MKHFWADRLDRFYMWLAWRLPVRLVSWCAVRVAAFASMRMGDRVMGSITVMEANTLWNKSND